MYDAKCMMPMTGALQPGMHWAVGVIRRSIWTGNSYG